MVFDDLESVYAYLRGQRGGRLECLHEYTTEAGEHVQYVVRWRVSSDEKVIRPAVAVGGRIELRFPERRVLYRLPALAGAETVIVVEGEKKADLLAEFGFVATTSAGGSNAADKTSWEPLAGKTVILWPDADTAGAYYAETVRQILEPLGCTIKTICPADLDLQDGEDVVDFVEQWRACGGTDLEIQQKLLEVFTRKAVSTGPGQAVQQHLAEIGAGRWEPLQTGFSCLDSLVPVLPGSLNLLCGGPGASKSLLMLQLAACWHRQGIPTALFLLEQDRTHHLRRVLAQQAGRSGLADNRWVREHPEEAKAAAEAFRDFLDSFGRSIWALPEKVIYQRDVLEWLRQRAGSGQKVLIVDPATRAERDGEPWVVDAKFVNKISRIAVSSRTFVFLVLHPSKIQNVRPDLNAIAGGAAYSRFADNILWLENHEPKRSDVEFVVGTDEVLHNRTIWALKTKDGPGTRARLAFEFDSGTLRLSELGRIRGK
jgi:5S rRNA maturation endonuclease (ribonuclease M5)/KaiC/GvpD/RAD55 family RecA-like ATPase